MKTPTAAAIAIIALVIGAAVGYIAAPAGPAETVTFTTTAPPVTTTATVTQTVTTTGGPPTAFSIQVIPESIEDSVPGQRCVFLVVVDGEEKVVSISATAPGSTITAEPQATTPGQVAEVTVIPDETSVGQTLTVTIQGEIDGIKQTQTATVAVAEHTGTEEEMKMRATQVRDAFIPWLAANHPEFGITNETEWTPTIVRPHIMVVMFYLFFSDEWEIGVSWHVMVAPHDWGRIYLRHRFTEAQPSHAFEISSFEAQEEPQYVDLKDAFAESVWR